ncbi:hypothetical protein BT69DRAFT_1296706 [Atractiella rhizophila]|nr:hypothetical protein BT69DRAFT_1296706 [Atractiella rhizophila]
MSTSCDCVHPEPSPSQPQSKRKSQRPDYKVVHPPAGQIDSNGSGFSFSGTEPQTMGREFKFTRFSEAMFFIYRVGILSHSVAHHPTIENTYLGVKITLTTHATSSLTTHDLLLAKLISEEFDRITSTSQEYVDRDVYKKTFLDLAKSKDLKEDVVKRKAELDTEFQKEEGGT